VKVERVKWKALECARLKGLKGLKRLKGLKGLKRLKGLKG